VDVQFARAWLRYSRRAPWILQDVDVSLGPGQVAVVLGRNGAGKTTLLSAAAGLLRADRGRILDRPASVGWVPERFPAGQPFTVRSYLTAMGRARGLRGPAVAAGIDHWVQRLHLGAYLDSRLAHVSKGTAQKVGLVQALIRRPDLLVLDEPWEGLDAQTREQVPPIIAEVLADGGSVLVSDHLGEVARLPGAVRWHVADGRVRTDNPSNVDERFIIEVDVAAANVASTVARLRDDGHTVLRVRAHDRRS
jgi:ABC-2 type transport system ATP-binding protein